MPENSIGSRKLTPFNTTLVYLRSSGRVLHVSNVELMEGAPPPPEFFPGFDDHAVDEACRIHGVARENLGIAVLDPGEYKRGLVYSVDPASGTVTSRRIGK
jgi:hypothetical protein